MRRSYVIISSVIMMNDEEFFEVLLRWNLWGNQQLNIIPRRVLSQIKPFMDYHGAIVIQGPRRAGKSTLLYLIIQNLMKEIAPERCLYINFEDYTLSSLELTPSTIQRLLEVYGEKVYSGEDFFLFLDEVQNVKDWHRWVRTFLDTHHNNTVFISGSSSKLLSSELAGLLTGRHVVFETLPFSFSELVINQGYSTDSIYIRKNKNAIKGLLAEYMRFGGFPEVVLRRPINESRARRILTQYAEDILFKDISTHYNVLNMKLLKFVSLFLAQNSGCKLSIRGLQKVIEAEFGEKSSTTTIANYIQYLEEAYMSFEVRHFDYSIKRAIRRPSKYYMVDTGLRNAMCGSLTPDRGKLLENVVYLYLRTIYDDVFYWSGKREIDFVCREGKEIDLYNITYVSDVNEISVRELEGFLEFPSGKAVRKRYLITWDLQRTITHKNITIEAIPAYVLLLQKSENW